MDPNAFVRVRETTETAWQERLRRACHSNLDAYGLVREVLGETVAADRAAARGLLGYAYYCPEGGEYRHDALEGGAYCTIHGRPGRAQTPRGAAGWRACRKKRAQRKNTRNHWWINALF